MKSVWEWTKENWAVLLLFATAVAAFIHGSEDPPALKNARVREKKAKLRRALLEHDIAVADAEKADSEEDAAEYVERADTLQLRIVDLKKERDKLTGDFSDEAKKVRDEDLADADNARRAAGGRSGSVV